MGEIYGVAIEPRWSRSILKVQIDFWRLVIARKGMHACQQGKHHRIDRLSGKSLEIVATG
jgi:hypothetical protein